MSKKNSRRVRNIKKVHNTSKSKYLIPLISGAILSAAIGIGAYIRFKTKITVRTDTT